MKCYPTVKMSSRGMFSFIILITAVTVVSFNEAQGSYYSDYSDYSDEDWDLMPGEVPPGREDEEEIIESIHTNFGKWGDMKYCPRGYYAKTARIKVEGWQGDREDDSSVNGIALYCLQKWSDYADNPEHKITSWVGKRGEWRDKQGCDWGSRVIGFSLKVDGHCKSCDDVATTGLILYCGSWRNGHLQEQATHELYGNKWGEWRKRKMCPPETYVCGIQTQIDDYGNQADAQHGQKDVTGLNSVRMACCYWDGLSRN